MDQVVVKSSRVGRPTGLASNRKYRARDRFFCLLCRIDRPAILSKNWFRHCSVIHLDFIAFRMKLDNLTEEDALLATYEDHVSMESRDLTRIDDFKKENSMTLTIAAPVCTTSRDNEDKLEAVTERIQLLRKELSNTKHKKCMTMATLKQLSELEDQLQIKLDEELRSEKTLLAKRTRKHIKGDNLLFKFNIVESLDAEITSIPLDSVEKYLFPDITCTYDSDPSDDVTVKLEEVDSCGELYEDEYSVNENVRNDASGLEENLDDYEAPSNSHHANQFMEVDNSTCATSAPIPTILVSLACEVQEMDPNNKRVEFESVHSWVENDVNGGSANESVETTTLENNLDRYDIPSDSQHANQSTEVNDADMDATFAAITSTIGSSTWQVQDVNPNNMPVELEEVHSWEEQETEEYVEIENVLDESTATLDENLDSYDTPSQSTNIEDTVLDATATGITSAVESLTCNVQAADPENMPVECEKVHLCLELDEDEHSASQNVLNESSEPDQNRCDRPVNAQPVNRSMDCGKSEMDVTASATIESPTLQDEGLLSSLTNDISSVFRTAKKFPPHFNKPVSNRSIFHGPVSSVPINPTSTVLRTSTRERKKTFKCATLVWTKKTNIKKEVEAVIPVSLDTVEQSINPNSTYTQDVDSYNLPEEFNDEDSCSDTGSDFSPGIKKAKKFSLRKRGRGVMKNTRGRKAMESPSKNTRGRKAMGSPSKNPRVGKPIALSSKRKYHCNDLFQCLLCPNDRPPTISKNWIRHCSMHHMEFITYRMELEQISEYDVLHVTYEDHCSSESRDFSSICDFILENNKGDVDLLSNYKVLTFKPVTKTENTGNEKEAVISISLDTLERYIYPNVNHSQDEEQAAEEYGTGQDFFDESIAVKDNPDKEVTDKEVTSHESLNGSSNITSQPFQLKAAEQQKRRNEYQRYLRVKSHQLRMQKKEQQYGCTKCNLLFMKSAQYRAHMRSKHTDNKPYICSQCNKCFTARVSLTNHLKLHAGQLDYLCTICGRGLVTSNALKQHMEKHTRQFRCDVCGKHFPNFVILTKHKLVHSNECPYLCTTCGCAFRTTSILSYHMMSHNVKPHVCLVCDNRFHQYASLKSHMRKHTGEKPFACYGCAMTFSNRYTLKTHMLSHNDANQEMFACPECDKKFVVAGSLKAHLVSHSSDTPHRCNKCAKQYKRKHSLRKHKAKVHRGLSSSGELLNILPADSY